VTVRRISGTWGWVGLLAYVIAWDSLAPETLSSAYWRALRRNPALALFIVGWTASHLIARRPARILVRW
jgi:hypothetical protein